MRQLIRWTAIVAVILLGGCGDPRVDTSTDQKMKDSIAKVKAALPGTMKTEFEEALKTLAFAEANDLRDLEILEQTGGFESGIKERIGGKTGPEIIAEAERIRTEKELRQKLREAEQDAARKQLEAEKEVARYLAEEEHLERHRQQVITEIQSLKAKLDNEKPELLSKFIVERSRFGEVNEGFIRQKSIILTVRNEIGQAISLARFHALLLTPGRELPWVDAEANYQIPGGLESGESATWSLRPNMFSEWHNAPPNRDDMLLIVRPIGLDSSDGRALAGDHFDASDERKLRELLESIKYNGKAELIEALEHRARSVAAWKENATAKAAKAERDELAKKKADATSATTSMAKFVVEKSRFYYSKSMYSLDPVIDLTIRNETSLTITRFNARGVLASPGRETPWVDDAFNYSIPGGMEPGETQSFKLAPSRFGEYGKAPEGRSDMVLTVTIKQLYGPDGDQLFKAEFSEYDARRLAALEKLGEMGTMLGSEGR